MNKIVGAEKELTKKIKFIDEKEKLNKAIKERYLSVLEGVMDKTKLIIDNNLKKSLPVITMNNISNISLEDLDTMISNMHYR